jgi:hypothetical protein
MDDSGWVRFDARTAGAERTLTAPRYSYLILPGLYARQPELKISQPVLTVFVVALLTAGYSFTALLCFACRDEIFQAESIFLPALASSGLGLLTIAYNFLCSRSYVWATAAITGTVVSTTSTILYGGLLLWTYRRIALLDSSARQRPENLWSDQPYYKNFLQNMYPSAVRTSSSSQHLTSSSTPGMTAISEDDRINQQMAKLLAKRSDDGSPDAASATFHIDLPEDREQAMRMANSSELLGSPPPPPTPTVILPGNTNGSGSRRGRNTSLSEEQAWERWDRGRTVDRPRSTDGRSNHSRAVSREERRREIELGQI